MSDAASNQHPAPHAHRVSGWALTAALLAGPVVWFLQLNLLYGFGSQVCFPRDQPRLTTPAGFAWLTTFFLVVNVIALVITAGATFVSWRHLRRTREEAKGEHPKLVETGEGRTRFLSAWGLWGGLWFIVAILFDTIAVLWLPICGG